MTNPLARLIDALDPTATAKAAAITGQQAPTTGQLADDSAKVAAMFGPDGNADGPDLDPVYEPERPLVTEVADAVTRAVRSTLLGSPAPNRVTVYRINPAADVAGISVQLVPPSEGRRRRVLLQCVAGTCYISPDRRDTGSPTVGDVTGFPLDDGVTLVGAGGPVELMTTGELYASSDDAYDVRVLIEHYPEG